MKFIFSLVVSATISLNIAFAQNSATTFRNYLLEKDYERAGSIAQNVLNENPRDFQLTVSVGDVYFELEEYDKALNAYTKARNINSNDSKIYVKLGRTLIAMNRPKEAIIDLKKAIDKDKKNVELILELADAYLVAGDIKGAELQVSNARSIDSKNANVFLMLGKIYYEQNVWELAKNNYEEALKLEPNNVNARQNLANVYWKLAVAADQGGDVELLNEYLNRSLQECNTLVKNDEKDAASWRLKGQIHFNANQNIEAAQSYNKFLQLRPNNHLERWRLADLLAKNGVCDSAVQHLKIIINLTNNEIADSIRYNAKLVLGSCFYQLKQFSDAAQILTDANQTQELIPNDLKVLAFSFLLAGDTSNAITAFEKLFQKDPHYYCDIMLLVGSRIYRPMKKHEEAINILTSRVNNCSDESERENNSYCYYLIGTSHFDLKQIDEAIDALKKSIELNPNNFWAYIYLGDVYWFQKNIPEGEKQFNLVIENCKSNTEKYKNELNTAFQKLCDNRLQSKKYKELEKFAKDWINLFPDANEFAYLYLAIAFQGNGDQANACKNYREVLKINKDNKTARDNLKSLGC